MKVVVFWIVFILLTGCASINIQPPSSQPIEKSKIYKMPYDKAWLRAVDWFADHDVVIEKLEKTSGLITAKYLLKADDGYLDCGDIQATGVMAPPVVERYGSLNVTIREKGSDSTKVNVNFFGDFKASANDAFDGKRLTAIGRCISTGKLEYEIHAYIATDK